MAADGAMEPHHRHIYTPKPFPHDLGQEPSFVNDAESAAIADIRGKDRCESGRIARARILWQLIQRGS
jgi:hypothetical protein